MPVFIDDNIESMIIDLISFNVVYRTEHFRRSSMFWTMSDEDFVRIQLLSGEIGYIQRKHLRSAISYRFYLARNYPGEWQMTIFVAGD